MGILMPREHPHEPGRRQFRTPPRRYSVVQGNLSANRTVCADLRWIQVLGIGREMRRGRAIETARLADRTQDLPVLRGAAVETGRQVTGCRIDEIHPCTGLC